MKHITRMLILLLFMSGVFTISSNMTVTSSRLNSVLDEQQFNDTVKNSLTMNIMDRPVRIAIYFEANTSIPSYSHASDLTNSYSEVQNLFESAGYEVTLLTTADILNHRLITANYDVFVLINHLPRESIVQLVKEFWLGGGGILSFNSAISYLFYYGLLVPELEGNDRYFVYWDYYPVEYMNVTARHPITKEYQINDEVYERPEDWVVYWVPVWSSSVETGAINLLNNFTEPNYGYAVAVDSTYRGGRVVQLPGDGTSITDDFESIIINAADWLVPKPKGRIVYDLSHQPRLCVDFWDTEFATVYTPENSFAQLRNSYVNHSYTFDKFYPSTSGNFTSERLASYDILIICLPDLNFTIAERTTIEDWISTGGSLMLLGDRKGIGGTGDLAINFLLDDFSMKLSEDDILSITTASVSEEHPTLEGCSTLSISLRNYITITDPSAQAIWDDLGIPVVAAQGYNFGRVILFSDMNILDNGRLKLVHNNRFAINVANWLSSTTAEVLLFTNSAYNPTVYRSPIANALNELNLDFRLTSSVQYLELGLEERDWQLVLIDEANYDAALAYDGISDYLDTTDGRIIMSVWNMDAHSDHLLWAKMDVAFAEEWENNEPAYIWDPTHSIFNTPIDYQALILDTSGYSDDGDKVHVLNNAIALAGSSTSESENSSGIVLGNNGQTLINSFMIDGMNDDFDDSTYKDAYEIWLNEIAFMMRPTINSPADLMYVEKSTNNNITWSPSSWYPHDYSVDINGTVANTSLWDGGIVFFDADGLEPGIHLVTLTVIDGLGLDAADTVLVNVTAKADAFPFDIDPELIIIVGAIAFILLVTVLIFRKRRKHH